MQAPISRLASRFVSLAKNATGDRSSLPVQRGEGGFSDRVMVALLGLEEFRSSPYRALPDDLSGLLKTGSVQAIDATGFDRRGASRRYANRTNYWFKAVKTTVPVDCNTSLFLDIHCSMKQTHDTQIGPPILERDPDRVGVLTADKGATCCTNGERGEP